MGGASNDYGMATTATHRPPGREGRQGQGSPVGSDRTGCTVRRPLLSPAGPFAKREELERLRQAEASIGVPLLSSRTLSAPGGDHPHNERLFETIQPSYALANMTFRLSASRRCLEASKRLIPAGGVVRWYRWRPRGVRVIVLKPTTLTDTYRSRTASGARPRSRHSEGPRGRTFGPFPWPRVLRLVRYVKTAFQYARSPAWSKRGVLRRDGHRCGYCHGRAETVDHLLPQSRGGRNSWLNTVAACMRCNHLKANRTPGEAGSAGYETPHPDLGEARG